MRCTRTKILVSHGLVKPPVFSSYSTVSGNSGLVGVDTSKGSFISKRGTSLADLHACLQMKSTATAAQSEAGTALHAGLPGPVKKRPLQCTPRLMQMAPTQPSSTSSLLSPAYWLVSPVSSEVSISRRPDYMAFGSGSQCPQNLECQTSCLLRDPVAARGYLQREAASHSQCAVNVVHSND